MSQADIDGALVGGASLKAESFAGIVRFKVDFILYISAGAVVFSQLHF